MFSLLAKDLFPLSFRSSLPFEGEEGPIAWLGQIAVQYGGHFTAIERSREEIRAIHRMSPVWR
jgi:hypothetical protein